jgi:tetratricopeptide (TPR) repeat protein
LERLRAQAQSGTDLLQKGRRLEEAGDWAAAAEAYRQAAAADARLVQAQMNLIGVYGRLGAIAQAEESHRISGGGAEADYNLGVVRLGAQQFREAEALFRAAVQANPHFADAWNNLGLVRQAQGATEEARSSFQRALDSAPRHAEANVNLARLLSRAGADGAEKHFQLAIDSAPGRSLAAYRFYFAEYLQRAQRSADAMLQLQEARRNAEQNAQNEMAAYLDRVLREWSQRAP